MTSIDHFLYCPACGENSIHSLPITMYNEPNEVFEIVCPTCGVFLNATPNDIAETEDGRLYVWACEENATSGGRQSCIGLDGR